MSEAIAAALIGGLVGSLVAGLFNLLPVILSLRSQERQHAANAEWRFNELFLREEIDALKSVRKAIIAAYDKSVLLAYAPFAEADELYASQKPPWPAMELITAANLAGAWLPEPAGPAIASLQAAYLDLRSLFFRQYQLFKANPTPALRSTLQTPEGSKAFSRVSEAFQLAMHHTEVALAPASLQSLRGRAPLSPDSIPQSYVANYPL
jgi:hypothetical protein